MPSCNSRMSSLGVTPMGPNPFATSLSAATACNWTARQLACQWSMPCSIPCAMMVFGQPVNTLQVPPTASAGSNYLASIAWYVGWVKQSNCADLWAPPLPELTSPKLRLTARDRLAQQRWCNPMIAPPRSGAASVLSDSCVLTVPLTTQSLLTTGWWCLYTSHWHWPWKRSFQPFRGVGALTHARPEGYQIGLYACKGLSKSLNPLWSISCIKASNLPISPLGKPFRANQFK